MRQPYMSRHRAQTLKMDCLKEIATATRIGDFLWVNAQKHRLQALEDTLRRVEARDRERRES